VLGSHWLGSCGPVTESLISSPPGIQHFDCSLSLWWKLFRVEGWVNPRNVTRNNVREPRLFVKFLTAMQTRSSGGIRSQVGLAAVPESWATLLGSVHVTRFVYPCEETLFSGSNSTLRYNSYLRGKEVAFGSAAIYCPVNFSIVAWELCGSQPSDNVCCDGGLYAGVYVL